MKSAAKECAVLMNWVEYKKHTKKLLSIGSMMPFIIRLLHLYKLKVLLVGFPGM